MTNDETELEAIGMKSLIRAIADELGCEANSDILRVLGEWKIARAKSEKELDSMTRGQLKVLVRELEAQVAFLRHQKIVCCKCGKPFDILYICPACGMKSFAVNLREGE
jgi:hypothetical protein